MSTIVRYAPYTEAWPAYYESIAHLIRERQLRVICDVGGGANPTLPAATVSEWRLDYSILDISKEELDKAPAAYRKIEGDICGPLPSELGRFDLVISKMLAEHVPSGRDFHANIFQLLRPGGFSLHFFPTLFSTPFVINRLAPEKLSQYLLDLFAPRDKYRKAKFPAYYDWCRGPSKSQLSRFRKLGYEVVSYTGFFGHNYWYRVPPVAAMNDWLTRKWLASPMPSMTSYAMVVLRRPTD